MFELITKELIARINELSKKSKTVGLTDEEMVERDRLRKEYLGGIRAQLKSQLDSIELVDPDDPRLQRHQHGHSCSCGHGDHQHDEGHECGCGHDHDGHECQCNHDPDHKGHGSCGCKHSH